MNKIFNGKFPIILITVIVLLCCNLALATDYSVTAGNYQVNFKSNHTFFTEVKLDNKIYSIWLKENPGDTIGQAAINILEYDRNIPFGKEALKEWMNLSFREINGTPILSDYLIDGTDAVIAEGWSTTLSKIEFGAMYPLDINSYGSAHKAVWFRSSMDRKTNLEVVNSLHVEYKESPPTTQTPAPVVANNMASQGKTIITTNEIATIVKQNAPSVDQISVVIDTIHIGVSFAQIQGITTSDTIRAVTVILQTYASILIRDPTYNGYLRISGVKNGQVIATFEATAYDTRANTDPTTGLLSIDYINQVMSGEKRITYYTSDGYGDVSKAVEVPGGRAGPSQGSWL